MIFNNKSGVTYKVDIDLGEIKIECMKPMS